MQRNRPGSVDPRETRRRCFRERFLDHHGDLLGSFFNAPGWSTDRLFAFVARGLAPGKQELEKEENIRVFVKSSEEALTMIARSEIVDGQTISTLSLYAAKYGTLSWTIS